MAAASCELVGGGGGGGGGRGGDIPVHVQAFFDVVYILLAFI